MDNEQSPLADVPNAFVGADGQLVQLDSRTAEPSSSGSDWSSALGSNQVRWL